MPHGKTRRKWSIKNERIFPSMTRTKNKRSITIIMRTLSCIDLVVALGNYGMATGTELVWDPGWPVPLPSPQKRNYFCIARTVLFFKTRVLFLVLSILMSD